MNPDIHILNDQPYLRVTVESGCDAYIACDSISFIGPNKEYRAVIGIKGSPNVFVTTASVAGIASLMRPEYIAAKKVGAR
jgi:hypothetical protein